MVDKGFLKIMITYVKSRTRKFLFAKKSHEKYHKYGTFSTIWKLANWRSSFGKKIVAFYV